MPPDQSHETPTPLLVSKKNARQLLGIGPTKCWQLCRDGAIETVRVGKSDLVVYASLTRLAAGKAVG